MKAKTNIGQTYTNIYLFILLEPCFSFCTDSRLALVPDKLINCNCDDIKLPLTLPDGNP